MIFRSTKCLLKHYYQSNKKRSTKEQNYTLRFTVQLLSQETESTSEIQTSKKLHYIQ